MALCSPLLTALISGFLLVCSAPTAGAQARPLSLVQERAAAKAEGFELSPAALSPPMPPVSENAAPLYKKLGDEANARIRDEIARVANDSKPTRGQSEYQLLEKSSHHPNALTTAEWKRVRAILTSCRAYIEEIRDAARKPKFVLAPNEFVPELHDEIVANFAFPTAAAMREAARLLVSESIWEAHDGCPDDAIRDLTLGLRMARHYGAYKTVVGYLVAEAIYGLNISGFKAVLRMYGGNPAVCRSVQAAIFQNFVRPPVSDALKIELAAGLDTVDQLMKAVPKALNVATGKGALGNEAYAHFLDEYGACNLRAMMEAIAIVDAPSATSAPVLRRLTSEIEKKYPDSGILPPRYCGSPDLPFHRDTMSNNVNITLAGASVLIYRVEHHAYPKSLSDAMSNPTVRTASRHKAQIWLS